jgi:hypothetical protein
VSKVIEEGIDPTVQLILSSLDKNRRLNKSNQRFKKLNNSRLMAYCGYSDTLDFLELRSDDLENAQAHGNEVIEEIKRQRAQRSGKGITADETAVTTTMNDVQSDSHPVQAPWLTPTQ